MPGGPGGTPGPHAEKVGLRVEHVGHARLRGAHRHGGVGGGEGRAGATPPESIFSFLNGLKGPKISKNNLLGDWTRMIFTGLMSSE